MRKIVFVLFLFTCFQADAQFYLFRKRKPEEKTVTQFPKDENGKIIFYEVVTVDTVPRDTLWKNARNWMYNLISSKTDKVTVDEYLYGNLECETSYMVYVPSMISKMTHGKISYKVAIDIKDKKYRYTFSDFVFQPYRQERKDLKYYPVKGRYKPLEEEKYGGFQSAWNSHRAGVKTKVQNQIAYLKQEIVKKTIPIPLDTAKVKPVIKTKDW